MSSISCNCIVCMEEFTTQDGKEYVNMNTLNIYSDFFSNIYI